jgi:hypothetical protein
VTIRILADREPYTSYADETATLVIMNGPAELDAPEADFIVLPAEDFLALGRRAERGRRGPRFIAYGPVALMAAAFESGSSDYLREPWSLPELHARLSRLLNVSFRWKDATLGLLGSILLGQSSACLDETERELLLLLLRSAPLPVTKEALDSRGLGHCVASLRQLLDAAQPGLGNSLRAVRGLGYRLDVLSCG